MVFKKTVFALVLIGLMASCASKKASQFDGRWEGSFELSTEVSLPVVFEIIVLGDDTIFTLINGAERLDYTIQKGNQDSLTVRLEPYNSSLSFTVSGSKIQGIWRNYAKGPDNKISFNALPSTIEDPLDEAILNSKYQVQFGFSAEAYPAVLLLDNVGSNLSGTIKTETGDYRYLWGQQTGDSIWLACFDGAHAFLFTATQKEDSLLGGKFYSGNHYQDIWKANLNPDFQLTDPTKLTQVVSDSGFRFTLLMSNGETVDHSNEVFKNKVTCIQIMGTWCPNCKDETEFLKEIRSQYSADDLQIIAAAFEYEKDTNRAFKRINSYSESMKMNYPIYYGGSTNKKKVTDVFPDLDQVISYPTLIILDKKGNVKQVHTGFNGPATDEYFIFAEHTNQLIDSLMIE